MVNQLRRATSDGWNRPRSRHSLGPGLGQARRGDALSGADVCGLNIPDHAQPVSGAAYPATERSATDTEQVKCLPDPVSCLRKTENTGVDRIVTRVLVGPSAWHCFIRRIVYAWFARVCHGRSVPYAPDRMNNLNLRCTTLCRPSGIRTLGCFRKWCGSPVGLDPLPDPNFGTSERSVRGIIHVAPFHRWSCWPTARSYNSGRRTVRLKSKGDDGMNPWIRPRPIKEHPAHRATHRLPGSMSFRVLGP
jgi:hypothetical protein